MEKRLGIFFLLSVVVLIMVLNLISADIGRHPDIRLSIKQDGLLLPDTAIVCYNSPSYMRGDENVRDTSKDYVYVKDMIESKEYNFCSYCPPEKEGCWATFQILSEVPKEMKIAVIYPVSDGQYRYHYNIYENTTPVIYKSDYFKIIKGINIYNYKYEVNLNSNGTITLKDKTPIFSFDTLLSFILALILTITIELLYTRRFFSKRGISPQKATKVILLVNIISLPILWFIFPLLIKGIILVLIVGEIFVFLLESFMIYGLMKKELDIKNSMKLSLLNNLFSLVIGGIILSIILEFLTSFFGI